MGAHLLVSRPTVPDAVEQPGVALLQDGIFTRRQAREAGWSDDRQRRLIRVGLWVPVAGGILRHREVGVGPWQAARTVSLTAGLVVSHGTAGALWGWAVTTGLHGIGRLDRLSSSVTAHRTVLPPADRVDVARIVLTTPTRTLTDLLCHLPEEASVAMVTDALRRSLLTAADLIRAASGATGRTGAARARSIAASCARAPHSVLEWRFHRILSGAGTGWTFNAPIHDEQGLIGYVDALHAASRTVVELDGRTFHGPDRFQSDRTRDQRLVAAGYVVLRFTWEDVERRDLDVRERIRRTVALRMPPAQ